MSSAGGRVITGQNIRTYFHQAVGEALARQGVQASEDTVVYLINLLSGFLRSESLYDMTPDGPVLSPLAFLYGRAAAAQSARDRSRFLRKLGDVALFISGIFSSSLSRSLVDVDYYIAMGGNAYGCLAKTARVPCAADLPGAVFAELAAGFARFVDVLAEVGDRSGFGCSRDVLRLYEIWLGSGSPRAAAKLREMGIEPVITQRHVH